MLLSLLLGNVYDDDRYDNDDNNDDKNDDNNKDINKSHLMLFTQVS